jgi:hypothetical protein
MRTFTSLKSLFKTLSQNSATVNDTLAGELINFEHRYLLQKYFDNERTFSTVTVGAQDLTLTASRSAGDTTGTLTAAWTSITCQQLVVFSSGEQRTVTFTQGSTHIFWQPALTQSATTAIATIGVQAYPLPANISKIKNNTITVGQLVYTPAPVRSIQEWTMLNALPYTSDIPNNYFIYNNQLMFWPIPSTSGNLITFNYQTRVADMSYEDYTTGTISGATVGSNAITGSATSWTSFPQNVDLSYINLMFRITPNDGDGLWYPIQRFTSATALTLNLPLVNVNELTSANYTIGQVPLLHEDFQDMLVYGALKVYYNSIVKDKDKFALYESLYQQKLQLMEAYLGTKSVNVDLGAQPVPRNPNLFVYSSQQ